MQNIWSKMRRRHEQTKVGGSPTGSFPLVELMFVLIKATTFGHQSALAELKHNGWDYYRVCYCGQAEISWKALFVQQ